MQRFFLATGAACLSLLPRVVFSQEGKPPQVEFFGDWELICAAADDHTCQMAQSAAAGEGDPVFLLSIAPAKDRATDYAVASAPLGVYLANGIEIRIDGGHPFKVLYEVCDRESCHAGFRLSGAVLSAFRKGLDAGFRVWTAKDRAVDFDMSLRGFSAAYAEYRAKVTG
ncbi:Invasion protein B, involved in pathogenesis [Martelella mediterranea DSM 17316]|uniref:Invasion protein B, involved in pathogenesis n=2 Tax=Martelella mediterranea TaxID=293089 RepID=A0A1U9Z022_9HYPH|nr:Invasion protein B, involved in pathogenesis [Martelella mediterranea DSM 17316]